MNQIAPSRPRARTPADPQHPAPHGQEPNRIVARRRLRGRPRAHLVHRPHDLLRQRPRPDRPCPRGRRRQDGKGRADAPRPLEPALGQGILTSEGARWRLQRRTAAPAFRPANVNRFLTRDRSRRRARPAPIGWRCLAAATALDVGREMMHVTFRIIMETMLSGAQDVDTAQVERSYERLPGKYQLGDRAVGPARADVDALPRQAARRARAGLPAAGHRQPCRRNAAPVVSAVTICCR